LLYYQHTRRICVAVGTDQTDQVTISTASEINSATGDNLVNLAQNWQAAEFNVVGDTCSSQANFNGGSTIVVEIAVDDGTSNTPSAVNEGFTGETNNLNLVIRTCPVGGSFPAVVFTQSNTAGATSTCFCGAAGERCVGSGDCCSGSCSGVLGSCQCLSLGSVCPADNAAVCCGPNTCVVNFPGQHTGICNQARGCKPLGAVCLTDAECCAGNCASPLRGTQRHCAVPQ
jgi:hypothetical protein